MADSIISQFERTYAFPLETYRQVPSNAERDAIPAGVRWEGMLVYSVADNQTYELRGGTSNADWQVFAGSIGDAPNDGNEYVRKNQGWALASSGIIEAPIDGNVYGRRNGAWLQVEEAGGVAWGSIVGTLADQTDLQNALAAKLSDAPSNGSEYVRINGTWAVASGGGGGGGTWGSITGTLSDQTDLQTALNGKAATSHTHTEADITDLQNYALVGANISEFNNNLGFITGVQWGDITGQLSNQTDLNNALNSKAATVHTHTEADITDLQNYVLPGDNISVFTNDSGYLTSVSWGDIAGSISSQTDLQNALNDKANISHTHEWTDILNAPSFITEVAWGDITGTLANQTDLNSVLSTKADTTGAVFTGDISVPGEAFGVSWNTSQEVPTKNDVYDQMILKLDASAYTAADVLAKLLTVDGPGSGLNADSVDGFGATDFYRSNQANTGGTGSIQLNDGFSFTLGNGSDLVMRHSGGNNLFDMSSGNLLIRDGTTTRFTFGRTTGNLNITGSLDAVGNLRGSVLIADGVGDNIRIYGSGTGNGNIGYISFYESNGSTRQAYIGLPTGSNDDLYVNSDVGAIRLVTGGATTVFETGKIDTTGVITTTGNTIVVKGDSPRLRLEENSFSQQWTFIQDGGNFTIRSNNTADVRATFLSNGSVTLGTNTAYVRRTQDGDLQVSRDNTCRVEIIGLASSGGIVGTDTAHDLILRRNNVTKITVGNALVTSVNDISAPNFRLSSDARLKSDIQPLIPYANKIQWRTFLLNGKQRYGVIAQEVEKVNPDWVNTDDNGYKSVNYIDLLCAKVAELEHEIKILKANG